jgi:hypothetical protein
MRSVGPANDNNVEVGLPLSGKRRFGIGDACPHRFRGTGQPLPLRVSEATSLEGGHSRAGLQWRFDRVMEFAGETFKRRFRLAPVADDFASDDERSGIRKTVGGLHPQCALVRR